MGSRCCKPSAASKYQTHEDNGSSPPHGDEEPQEPATKKDVAPLYEKSTSPASSSSTEPLVAKAKDATEAGKPEQEEREGEEVGGEEGECRERESSVSPLSPSEPLPLKRVKDQDRKDSMFSFNVGSTESLVGLFGQDRLNPADFKNKPIKFKKIQPTIQTGDLALLYRREHPVPHVAIFVNHVETDPLFPLLLVKGKTKPLPREKFHPGQTAFHPSNHSHHEDILRRLRKSRRALYPDDRSNRRGESDGCDNRRRSHTLLQEGAKCYRGG
ncbi:hypothetical protein GBAR_LOCUS17916 [Geodia barretti]|uniref:Uncharacterized protein n=1 Tax=Geodia barretti TaxID=519541 RepID=A0AA35SK40_GEOBA|nr:hypothetical protein GBAR_LOCUS17916 [Geodia barretti]